MLITKTWKCPWNLSVISGCIQQGKCLEFQWIWTELAWHLHLLHTQLLFFLKKTQLLRSTDICWKGCLATLPAVCSEGRPYLRPDPKLINNQLEEGLAESQWKRRYLNLSQVKNAPVFIGWFTSLNVRGGKASTVNGPTYRSTREKSFGVMSFLTSPQCLALHNDRLLNETSSQPTAVGLKNGFDAHSWTTTVGVDDGTAIPLILPSGTWGNMPLQRKNSVEHALSNLEHGLVLNTVCSTEDSKFKNPNVNRTKYYLNLLCHFGIKICNWRSEKL